MAKFHLTPKGQARQCSAQTPESCRYSQEAGEVVAHYDTKEEAQAAYEREARKEHSITKTLTKEISDQSSQIVVEGHSDFNAATAEPTDFDKVLSDVMERKAEAYFHRERAYQYIQQRFNKRKVDPITRKVSYAEDESRVIGEFIKKENKTASEKDLFNKFEEADKEWRKNGVLEGRLNQVFRKRGKWNRAFLVSDGHLHKSMNCSTCNKGDTPTKFAFMTEYSGKDEKQIVDDAGYRACTTCYPSAPIGDSTTLPSKMLTDEEKQRNDERKVVQEKKVQKAKDAVSKAPTLSGKPLKVMTGISSSRPEEFKTERAATNWYVDSMASTVYSSNENYKAAEKSARYSVLYNLAEKNDVSINDLQNDLHKKVEAKAKKNYKESLAMYEQNKNRNLVGYEKPELKIPDREKFDVPDEYMNKSPREWENSSYIPE